MIRRPEKLVVCLETRSGDSGQWYILDVPMNKELAGPKIARLFVTLPKLVYESFRRLDNRRFSLVLCATLLFSSQTVLAGRDAQGLCALDWLSSDCNRDSGSAIPLFYQPIGTQYPLTCNSGKKIPISFFESRNLVGPSVPRIER